MLYRGQPVPDSSRPSRALNAGIAMVFQETSLVPSMTVAQTSIGARKNSQPVARRLYLRPAVPTVAEFPVDPAASVASLGAAPAADGRDRLRRPSQRRDHIRRPEPTASLTPKKAALLRPDAPAENTRRLHRLHQPRPGRALAHADRITIPADGELVVTDGTANFDREKIVRAMVGRTLSDELPPQPPDETGQRKPGARVLSVRTSRWAAPCAIPRSRFAEDRSPAFSA